MEILFRLRCSNIILENGDVQGVAISNGKADQEIYAKHTVVATGRRGAQFGWRSSAPGTTSPTLPARWISAMRVEVRNEIMEMVNRVLYEVKLVGYPRPFKEQGAHLLPESRRLCFPGELRRQSGGGERHSYKNLKTDNTNLAFSAPQFQRSFPTSPCYARRWAG